MRRGEIPWADLPRPTGRRPVVLLSRDQAYAVREFVIVSPRTSRRGGLITEVELGPQDGLARPSALNLDVMNTVSKQQLQERIVELSPGKLRSVEAAIHFALGLET